MSGDNLVLRRFSRNAGQSRDRKGPGDAAVADLAGRQFGFVSDQQVRICGLSRKAAYGRRNRGLWRAWHRGVYYLGTGDPELRGEILGAILSLPRGGAAAGTTVTWLRGLTPRTPEPVELVALDVMTPPKRTGITISRGDRLQHADIHWVGPIPVTSIDQTLVDRARTADFDQLEAECALALRNHLTSMNKLRSAVDTAKGTPGIGKLREIVSAGRPAVTRSDNERILRRLVREGELPPALYNVQVGDYELDLYWPELRLGIEVDSFFTHGGEHIFEGDRWRDSDLATGDVEVRRFTDRQLKAKELAVVARLGAIVALRRRALALPEQRRGPASSHQPTH